MTKNQILIRELEELIRKAEKIKNILEDERYQEDDDEIERKYLESKVEQCLKELGVPIQINGYKYIKSAVVEIYFNPELLNNVVGKLYPRLAEIYNGTPSKIERGMRYAIEIIFSKSTPNAIFEYLGYNNYNFSTKKLTNKEFVVAISEKVEKM